jgi:hypothetical protein
VFYGEAEPFGVIAEGAVHVGDHEKGDDALDLGGAGHGVMVAQGAGMVQGGSVKSGESLALLGMMGYLIGSDAARSGGRIGSEYGMRKKPKRKERVPSFIRAS